jgi:phosphomannomutase
MAALESSLPGQFPEAAAATEYGVRLTFPDDAWTLVRPSGTEPYIRVYAESDDVDDLTDSVVGIVEDAIDATA